MTKFSFEWARAEFEAARAFPHTQRSLAAARNTTPVYASGFDIDQARRADHVTAALEAREHVHTVRDLTLNGVPCRYYAPAGATALILHVHGGGFVFHSIDVHDAACRRLALRSGMAVLSIEYRLAPEHPFPAALNDIAAVTRWLRQNHLGNPQHKPLFIHGDSAGANLALTTALRHSGVFSGLALLYPFLDPSANSSSYQTAEDVLDPVTTRWYWDQYARTSADLNDPDLAPLLNEDFSGLPPTFVSTAELDPLRDEGEVLVRQIAASGVSTLASRHLGVGHGHWMHPSLFPSAEMLTREVSSFFQMIAAP